MPRYCVVSYDGDEQQSFWDLVEAADADKAMEIVGEVRGDYADTVDAVTVKDLYHTIGQIESAATVATTAQQIRRHLKFDCGSTDYDQYFCRDCEGDNEDLEGWDGLCGACADKAERRLNETDRSNHGK